MKITSGYLKNMKIEVPTGGLTRPTSARVREAVMSTLYQSIAGSTVLDLFAGTGVFGLECVSRGASSVFFVEKNQNAIRTLKKNLVKASSRLEDCDLKLVLGDLFNIEQINQLNSIQPDIIWADPPYNEVYLWLSYFLDQNFLFPVSNGYLIIELSKRDLNKCKALFDHYPMYSIKNIKKYGDTVIIYVKREQ